jgi:ketosteroid isomerase-like protein
MPERQDAEVELDIAAVGDKYTPDTVATEVPVVPRKSDRNLQRSVDDVTGAHYLDCRK